LVEPYAKHLPQGQSKIKFKHDGLYLLCWRACWKGYDGANVAKWNSKVKTFVAQ